jgi:hypothetical protein
MNNIPAYIPNPAFSSPANSDLISQANSVLSPANSVLSPSPNSSSSSWFSYIPKIPTYADVYKKVSEKVSENAYPSLITFILFIALIIILVMLWFIEGYYYNDSMPDKDKIDKSKNLLIATVAVSGVAATVITALSLWLFIKAKNEDKFFVVFTGVLASAALWSVFGTTLAAKNIVDKTTNDLVEQRKNVVEISRNISRSIAIIAATAAFILGYIMRSYS